MKRLGTGLAIGVTWLLLLLYGTSPLLWLVTMLAAAIMLHEYHAMVHGPDCTLADMLPVMALGLFPVAASLSGQIEHVAASLFIGFLLLSLLAITTAGRHSSPFLFLLRSGFGIVSIGFLCSHLILLHQLEEGGLWLLYVSALTAAADTGAYFAGTAFGRVKLCPRVSPGKTVEGLAGGLAAAAAVGAILGPWQLHRPVAVMVPVSLALALAGVIGDLGESLLKRSCNVKDSGSMLPGHGGILDRVDALLMTMPALYYLLRLGIV